MSRAFAVVVLALAGARTMTGCGGDDAATSAPGASAGTSSGGSRAPAGEGYKPATTPTGWNEATGGGVPNPGGKCASAPGGVPKKLPKTGVEYCEKAHPDCTTAGAGCALYVTVNTDGAFFARVDDAAANGKMIVVELYTETDGNGVKDKLAEVPRVVATDFAGLDRERVFAIGWSAGAGAVGRGLCHVAKKSDFSEIGTTSDLYAAIVALGGCGCANDYVPLAPRWHVLTWNGQNDPFNGGDACEKGLRARAAVNGCASPNAPWTPVATTDPYARNADGSANAERIDFGACSGGAVTGYRFKDEGHVVSAKTHFDPKISGYDTVFEFLRDKKKTGP